MAGSHISNSTSASARAQPIKKTLRNRIHLLLQLALQIRSLILMNNPTLRQLVNHSRYLRQLLPGTLLIIARPQLTNGITRSLAIIFIPFPALGSLTHIFLRSLVISHSKILGRQR